MTNNSGKIRDPFDLSLKDLDGEEPGELKGGDYDLEDKPMKFASEERVDDDEENVSADDGDNELDGMSVVEDSPADEEDTSQ